MGRKVGLASPRTDADEIWKRAVPHLFTATVQTFNWRDGVAIRMNDIPSESQGLVKLFLVCEKGRRRVIVVANRHLRQIRIGANLTEAASAGEALSVPLEFEWDRQCFKESAAEDLFTVVRRVLSYSM